MVLFVFLQGSRGEIGPEGPTGPPGKRVSNNSNLLKFIGFVQNTILFFFLNKQGEKNNVQKVI